MERLCDYNIAKDVTHPRGGLNPYSKHFDKIGTDITKLLIEHAGLNRHSSVLDIGCGTGRLAKQITKITNKYCGFDINNKWIEYCRNNYNGDFQLLDIDHPEFNPNGSIQPQNVTFPYDDGSFDIIISIAVYNHFKPEWVNNYMSETTRILRNSGIVFSTFLLINNFSTNNTLDFKCREKDVWYKSSERPLLNVAISEENIRKHYINNGLTIKEPIRYGEWCHSPTAITGHDVIIAMKGDWNCRL